MPVTNVRTFQWIRGHLTGAEKKNDEAAQALLDVYDSGEDGQRVVENFLGRAGNGVQLSSQPIVDVYEAVKRSPLELKRVLTKRDFAVYQRCVDG